MPGIDDLNNPDFSVGHEIRDLDNSIVGIGRHSKLPVALVVADDHSRLWKATGRGTVICIMDLRHAK